MAESSKTPLLDLVQTPADLRRLEPGQLRQLADELRQETVDAVAVTGGHLGAGLGVIELTVALHYVFNTPEDRLIWDVGHQAYPHKILTGRRNRIRTLRQGGGLSGFTKRAESEYDPFGAAHSSTSISAGLGMAVARDLEGKPNHVIAVIGDGAMSAGMAYEAMNNAGAMNSRLIVILNDNDMSIAPPVGALSGYLARLVSGRTYRSVHHTVKKLAKLLPPFLEQRAVAMEEYARGLVTGGTLFDEMGFFYVGPIDGHNIDHLLPVLNNVRDAKDGPFLVHVVTKKGKGYDPAEKSADKYHGVVKFDVATGAQAKSKAGAPAYTKVYADALIQEARKDDKIVAITAAMPSGTGLDLFAKEFPNRCFDVGIAEQHGITFAAGLATEGLKPFATIYSTFLQRAYDQVVHDVAIQRLPVRFAMDRAGLVGADGPTHAGAFDVAYLGCLPGFVSWRRRTRPTLCTWWRPPPPSTIAPRRCAILAARAWAYRCRRKASRSRSARDASCARGPRWRCSRSAPGSPNASRQPTSLPRSDCRPRSRMPASRSRSIPICCFGSRASTRCSSPSRKAQSAGSPPT